MLSYLSYIGIPFISVCSSYAQYPDAESLLGRLGIKINENGKPVADGTGGCLPEVYDALTIRDSEKLTALCGDETALEEKRWNNRCILYFNTYKFFLAGEKSIVLNEADLGRIGDLVRSREFLTMVFGKGFVSEFETVAESSGKVYTGLTSCIDFQEYRCLCEKLRTLEGNLVEVRGKRNEEDLIVAENYSLCAEEYLERQEKIKSQIEKCEELLKEYVSQNEKYELLWKNWSVFDKISYDSNEKEVLLAEENFLKELGHVPNLKDHKHPVRISFSQVRTLLPEYLKSCSLFKKAQQAHGEALIKWKEEKKKMGNEIKKLFEEYRNRFAGEEYLTDEEIREKYRNRFAGEEYLTDEEIGEKIPISTEPVTVDIQIYQEHFEDKDSVRKLRTECWEQRVDDLNIKLRLTIDTRTRKLLSAFCMNRFIVNGQIITNFGTGLCIFKGE